jgi:hypothetical protein
VTVVKTRFGTAGAPAPLGLIEDERAKHVTVVKTRFGTAGAPAPSPAASGVEKP